MTQPDPNAQEPEPVPQVKPTPEPTQPSEQTSTEFVTRGGAHEHRYINGPLLRWCPATECSLEEFKRRCAERTRTPEPDLAAEVARLSLLNRQLEVMAKREIDSLRADVERLRPVAAHMATCRALLNVPSDEVLCEAIREMQQSLKYAIADSADDDTRVAAIAAEFGIAEHDGHGAIGIVGMVEELAAKLKSAQAEPTLRAEVERLTKERDDLQRQLDQRNG